MFGTKIKNTSVLPTSSNGEGMTISLRFANLSADISNILELSDPIVNIDLLNKKLTELGIRFNTDPKVYQKRDYWLLMCILYRTLTYLYGQDVLSIGGNFAKIARLVGRNLELINPIADGETLVSELSKDDTLVSVSYLTGELYLNDLTSALSNLTEQDYFILDCGTSTLNV